MLGEPVQWNHRKHLGEGHALFKHNRKVNLQSFLAKESKVAAIVFIMLTTNGNQISDALPV
jgi:hypothetical protein